MIDCYHVKHRFEEIVCTVKEKPNIANQVFCLGNLHSHLLTLVNKDNNVNMVMTLNYFLINGLLLFHQRRAKSVIYYFLRSMEFEINICGWVLCRSQLLHYIKFS